MIGKAWKSSGAYRRLLKLVCSAVWLAAFLLAARALDLTVPYLPLAIAGGLVFYLRDWPPVSEFAAWILLSAGFALIVRFPETIAGLMRHRASSRCSGWVPS